MAGAGARRRALAAAMAVCWANALTPAVGSVSSATRTLTVIGTVHTPSAVQRAEVRAVIDAAQPDAVVVELDAERLETLWDRSRDATPAYGAELAEAVRSARARGSLVVLGDAIKPVRAVVEAAPFLDLERIARGARLLAGATAALSECAAPIYHAVGNHELYNFNWRGLIERLQRPAKQGERRSDWHVTGDSSDSDSSDSNSIKKEKEGNVILLFIIYFFLFVNLYPAEAIGINE